MEAIWITIITVAAIIAALGVAIGVRRHRSNDYRDLESRDQPNYSQDAQTTAAARYSDRSGSGAGGAF
ncbi:MAG: hypothetical protein EPO52_10550 [Herbiconiux sp.]|uniref:hypothetical protein n=1 Tax=Herbiconiux sp. TaxID=1871186 RepID=UPI00120CF693|nr:hypothetical protein [Herbiconiux sp.]TAJ48553.1 MAG: hypothetical protein EPO52_10550 [Herbiconiux sp.]